MSIEKDIGRSDFYSPFHKALVNLWYTSRWFDRQISDILKEHKVQAQHINILQILHLSNKKLCPTEIKDIMLDSTGDLTRLVDKLVNFGHVERHNDPNDRRHVLLSITEAGEEFRKTVYGKLLDRFDEINNLTESESSEFSALLDKLRKSED